MFPVLEAVQNIAFQNDGHDHETAECFGKPDSAAADDFFGAVRINRQFIVHGQIPDFIFAVIRVLQWQMRPAAVFSFFYIRHILPFD